MLVVLVFASRYISLKLSSYCEMSSSGETTDDENNIRGSKKRKKNINSWKNNRIKNARLCGSSYVSTSGKTVPEKQSGPPCL